MDGLSPKSVDDLDDLARSRFHDHPAVIDHGVVIFAVARNRPQFHGRWQRLANHDPLAHRDRRRALAWIDVITAFGISRPRPTAAPTMPPTASPTGPATELPAAAPVRAPPTVVDWANAALEASSDATCGGNFALLERRRFTAPCKVEVRRCAGWIGCCETLRLWNMPLKGIALLRYALLRTAMLCGRGLP